MSSCDILIFLTTLFNGNFNFLPAERFTGPVWAVGEAAEQPTRRSKMRTAIVLHSGKLLALCLLLAFTSELDCTNECKWLPLEGDYGYYCQWLLNLALEVWIAFVLHQHNYKISRNSWSGSEINYYKFHKYEAGCQFQPEV